MSADKSSQVTRMILRKGSYFSYCVVGFFVKKKQLCMKRNEKGTTTEFLQSSKFPKQSQLSKALILLCHSNQQVHLTFDVVKRFAGIGTDFYPNSP